MPEVVPAMIGWRPNCGGQTGSDDYTWISGPNPGYGFGTARSDREPSSMDDHVEAIRDFLSAVDPGTGYIE